MDNFSQSDIETLERKLLELELTAAEHAVLAGMIDLAEGAATEVAGFGNDLRGLQPGRLGFLTDVAAAGTSVRPEGTIFASAGGLGSTRAKHTYLGGALGDE